ncbi:MAG: glycosyltransferase family 2 protein [Flavobacteriales bacterium]
MLSILIPVYQYDVRKLVNDLHQQCSDAAISFEIICMDDGSDPHFDHTNRSIGNITHVKYIRNTENKGRSSTRNALCRKAQYEFLLYLDCDAAIASKDFINNYLPLLGENKLISGGRIYAKHPPAHKDYLLHWSWGVKRELLDVNLRMRDPVNHFLSNNFVVAREIILKFPFDEEIRKYGYEDVYLAYQISQNGIDIVHIENPVIHEGLDRNADLLRKLDEASENILMLYKESKTGSRPFIIKSRLVHLWLALNKPLVSQIMRFFSFIMRPPVRFYLLHISPSIILLDLYRLLGLFGFKK